MSLELSQPKAAYNPNAVSSNRLNREPFKTPDLILPKEILNKLTVYGRRYYASVWNVANWRGQTSIWVDEGVACLRSGVKPHYLDSVRQELVRERLIRFEAGRPEIRNGKSLYTITDPDQELVAEWSDIFPEPTEQ